MDQRAEDNLYILKSILEDEDEMSASNSVENKAKLFYATCLKSSEHSKTTLHDIIQGIYRKTGE